MPLPNQLNVLQSLARLFCLSPVRYDLLEFQRVCVTTLVFTHRACDRAAGCDLSIGASYQTSNCELSNMLTSTTQLFLNVMPPWYAADYGVVRGKDAGAGNEGQCSGGKGFPWKCERRWLLIAGNGADRYGVVVTGARPHCTVSSSNVIYYLESRLSS